MLKASVRYRTTQRICRLARADPQLAMDWDTRCQLPRSETAAATAIAIGGI